MKKKGRKNGCQGSKHLRVIQDDTLFPYYRSFVQHRNQARWRGEDYVLLFYEWIDLYENQLDNRGRKVGNFRLERIDSSLPWQFTNIRLVEIIGKTKD